MANFVQTDNPFIRFVKYLIPWKGDSVTEIIRKVIFLLSAVVLVTSLVILLTWNHDQNKDTQTNDMISDLYHNTGNTEIVDGEPLSGSTTIKLDTEKQEEIRKENPEVLDEFIPLLEINEDVVGWISMGDENNPFIDYPVLQGEDDDFYLYHNIYGEKTQWGSIFAEYRYPLTADDEPANLILYGHNAGSGEYFGLVPRYFNYKPGNTQGIEFCKKYPTITFSSLYEKYTYKIFGGMLVNIHESEGEVFYYLRRRSFDNKAQFDEYIANILDRSTFYTDVDLKYGDHLLTLSTCIMDYGVDCRWVLFARRVREGEDPTVDVSKAYENPDPLFFDYYYNLKGGSWGGRKWPAEMIQGYSY